MGRRPRSKHLARSKRPRSRLPATVVGVDLTVNERVDVLEERELGLQAFEIYYRQQSLFGGDEEQFEAFMRALKKPLPISFRVSVVNARKEEVAAQLAEAQSFLQNAEQRRVSGLTVFKPTYFPWCNGWQLGLDDKLLRSARSGETEVAQEYEKLHAWIVANNSAGIITRQEVVSMVPVAVLDIQPSHRVLDMCASPGSKTTQALEALYQTAQLPSGFIVANELDAKRSYVLSRRCLSVGDPCVSLLVTSHRAQIFPDGENYDRIICDVPCSGDGTFRKYRDKWGHWRPHLGRELHALQLQIALRTAHLLSVGGMMSYSTCSLNPLENEAVIAALLTSTGGALELVQCSDALSGFKTSPGLHCWKVMDEEHVPFSTIEDVWTREPSEKHKRYRQSMWPPEEKVSRKLHLDRCLRIYPHLNNTGAFFVALVRKKSAWPPLKSMTAGHDQGIVSRVRRNDGMRAMPGESLTTFCTDISVPCVPKRLVVLGRSDCPKRAYAVTDSLAQHMASKRHRAMSTVSAGVCVGERQQHTDWRLTREGQRLLCTQ